MDLLQTLIRNPAFSSEAKQAILLSISKLGFDHSLSKILEALRERGTLAH